MTYITYLQTKIDELETALANQDRHMIEAFDTFAAEKQELIAQIDELKLTLDMREDRIEELGEKYYDATKERDNFFERWQRLIYAGGNLMDEIDRLKADYKQLKELYDTLEGEHRDLMEYSEVETIEEIYCHECEHVMNVFNGCTYCEEHGNE